MTQTCKRVSLLFPEGKRKALTMSYDDGTVEDRRLVSLFNQYGIKGTFHLNSGRMKERITAEEAQSLYAGHEIATHTYNHPHMNAIPEIEALRELLLDRMALEQITGKPVRGHSYPYGDYSPAIVELLKNVGIRYARTTKSNYDIWHLPQDFLTWHPTCHHGDARLSGILDTFLAPVHYAADHYCLYVWGHSYEFEHADNWELIENFCKKAGGHGDIWYATNIEIADYAEAYRRLRFTADCTVCENPSAMPLWLWVDKEKTVKLEAGQTLSLS